MAAGKSLGKMDKRAWWKKAKREDNIFMAIVFMETVVVVAIINYVMA